MKSVLKHLLKNMFGVQNIYDLIDKEIKGKFDPRNVKMNKSENMKDIDQN